MSSYLNNWHPIIKDRNALTNWTAREQCVEFKTII